MLRILAFVAILVAGLLIWAAPATAAAPPRQCSARYTACQPGPQGNGGCYQFPGQKCMGGRICHKGDFLCPKGTQGNGACYNPKNKVVCLDGLMCPAFWSLCRRGPKGGGGCYKPQDSTCDAGRIARRR